MSYNIEQIRSLAPSVFTTEKAKHLSDKYIQTPTIKVVEDLMNLGWEVTKVQEVKSRKYKGFQKHLLVFQNPSIVIKGATKNTNEEEKGGAKKPRRRVIAKK